MSFIWVIFCWTFSTVVDIVPFVFSPFIYKTVCHSKKNYLENKLLFIIKVREIMSFKYLTCCTIIFFGYSPLKIATQLRLLVNLFQHIYLKGCN
jgi:hypothetical protein